VTNPPIRAGKKVTYAMYAGAPDHLSQGGRLILVIRKQQGAESCFAYLQTLFSKVEKVAQKKGYRVLYRDKIRSIYMAKEEQFVTNYKDYKAGINSRINFNKISGSLKSALSR
jgi:hypothetical protein